MDVLAPPPRHPIAMACSAPDLQLQCRVSIGRGHVNQRRPRTRRRFVSVSPRPAPNPLHQSIQFLGHQSLPPISKEKHRRPRASGQKQRPDKRRGARKNNGRPYSALLWPAATVWANRPLHSHRPYLVAPSLARTAGGPQNPTTKFPRMLDSVGRPRIL